MTDQPSTRGEGRSPAEPRQSHGDGGSGQESSFGSFISDSVKRSAGQQSQASGSADSGRDGSADRTEGPRTHRAPRSGERRQTFAPPREKQEAREDPVWLQELVDRAGGTERVLIALGVVAVMLVALVWVLGGVIGDADEGRVPAPTDALQVVPPVDREATPGIPGSGEIVTPTPTDAVPTLPPLDLTDRGSDNVLSQLQGTPLPAPETVGTNELGRIPILMYHAFTASESHLDAWTVTFDQFREQLDWLRTHDFVMVGMQSMVDGRSDVPAGKRPVILTFDDSSPRQFGLQAAPGGGYAVKPDTAVGVLEAYGEQYPEFVGPAFFAVLPFNCFASDDDPSSCEEKLAWLVEHGYEIGNHTSEHVALTDVAPEFLTRAIGEMAIWIDARVPEGPGNLSHVLVLPFGAYPSSAEQRQWLRDGFWYLGEPVSLELVLAVNGGPAPPPYADTFFPAEVPRYTTEPELFAYWAEQIETGAMRIFVSDGDSGTVTVPADLAEGIDAGWLEARGLGLRTYERDEP